MDWYLLGHHCGFNNVSTRRLGPKAPVQPWLMEIEAKGFMPRQVFKAKETGLFWKRMPSHTFLSNQGRFALDQADYGSFCLSWMWQCSRYLRRAPADLTAIASSTSTSFEQLHHPPYSSIIIISELSLVFSIFGRVQYERVHNMFTFLTLLFWNKFKR